MKIKNVEIKNFRSLKDIKLEEIGNLCVLLGKNSSGKSNILEAIHLIFSEFALTGGITSGLNEYFWFNRSTTNPIEFFITIELAEDECDYIFPEELLNITKSVETSTESKEKESKYRELAIYRKIINLQGTWKTEFLKWGELFLIKDDKALTPEEVQKSWAEIKPPELSFSFTPQMLSAIHTKLVEKIKGRLKLISAIRDVKNPTVINRLTLHDSQIQSSIWSLDQSINPKDEEKYTGITTSFNKTTGQQLDPAQGQIFVRKKVGRIPLFLEGGGIQSALNLIFSIKSEPEKGYIFTIEEPETHSHPELQRKLFNELKSLSGTNQIFLSTHNSIFIDKSDLNNMFIVKMVENKTQIERISELKEALDEIGAKPSDIFFFSNKILFVEGKSEELVIPAFADNLSINLEDIAIVPVEGKSKARLNLKTWIKITRNALPIFLILDKDAKDELDDLKKEKLVQSGNYHVWQKGSIEDYYPHEILQSALEELNSRYSLDIKVAEIISRIKKGDLKPDRIDLGKKQNLLDKSWEVILAETISKLIKEKKGVEIADEVRRVLERVVAS